LVLLQEFIMMHGHRNVTFLQFRADHCF